MVGELGEGMKERLRKAGQEHVLKFWNTISTEEQQKLADQLSKIDFEEVTGFFKKCMSNPIDSNDCKRMRPVSPDRSGSIVDSLPTTIDSYFTAGLKAISGSEVGVILLAGGQGTRLGVSYPKGQYDVGLLSGKSLIQLQAERIIRLQHLARKRIGGEGKIPWYIMTSSATRAATEQYFKEKGNFGLDDVFFFDQGQLPCFTLDGSLILGSKSSIAMAPDGNGGLYRALGRSGALERIEKSGVKYLHVYCVDNILVRVADPYFVGFCISKGADCANKVVEKKDPKEPTGVVCVVEGVGPKVVEYTEITDEVASRPDPERPGKLAFRAGNIANHLFTTEFLSRVVREHEGDLVHHVAKKKIPTLDENGESVSPKIPNGIKIEKFVFDVFQFSKNFVTWEVLRDEEFSPLKNNDSAGVDCPKTSREDTYRLHSKWVMRGGMEVKEVKATKDSSVPPVEVSPLLSYCGEGLSELSSVTKCSVLTAPVYLSTEEEQNNNDDAEDKKNKVIPHTNLYHIPLDAQPLSLQQIVIQ